MKVNTKKLKFVLFLIVVLFSFLLIFFSSSLNFKSEDIESMLLAYYYPMTLTYILLMAVASATTLPITVVLAAGTAIFPYYTLILYSFIGILIGAVSLYYFSKYTGKDFLEDYTEMRGGKYKALKDFMKKDVTGLLIILNFTYIFPSTLGHVVAGVTNTKFWKFLLIALAGNFINVIGVILIVKGLYTTNYSYFSAGILILILSGAVPIFIYRKYIKDILVIAFTQKGYKRIMHAEKEIERTEKKIIKAEKGIVIGRKK
jgi:uncharacterized membrane protein YdjX (TVP38/TMEM64 family)